MTIDDQLPFDAQSRLLLPSTNNLSELWPALLSKAILKIMSLEYVNVGVCVCALNVSVF